MFLCVAVTQYNYNKSNLQIHLIVNTQLRRFAIRGAVNFSKFSEQLCPISTFTVDK